METHFQNNVRDVQNGTQSFPTETPAFLLKLWILLENSEYSQYIAWNQNGTSFTITNPNQFSQIVLPKFFKHSHLTSFVRQLNMYGFRKLTNVTYNFTTEEPLEFHHPQFIQSHPELLEFVRRKSPSSLRIGSRTIKTADLEKLISDFEHIKFEHESLLREFQDLKAENRNLKTEVLHLKSKYSRHEQVLGRMMNFIVLNALYPERTLSLLPGMKRRRLMLENNKDSQTVTFPEALNSSLSLNGHIDDVNNRNLLHPLDPNNLAYPQYINIDNVSPQTESSRNSLTLYNGNNLQVNPQNFDEKLLSINRSNQKGSHIRDDVRQAVLAKTGYGEDVNSLNNGQFQMFQHFNNEYPAEIPDYEQYDPQWGDNPEIVDFPDDMGLDSSLLSELLLPNPTALDTAPLETINNISNPQMFDSDLDSDINSFRLPAALDKRNDENTSIKSVPILRRQI